MKRKKLRIPLIVLAVIAILVACYVGFFMRAQPLLDCLPGTQPLLDCLPGTQPPAAGEVVRYTQDQPDGQSLALDDPQQVQALWQAIQQTQVRFLRGRGTALIPSDGAYYTVRLTSADGASVYAFGYNTQGGILIQGSDYRLLDEDLLGPALAAVFSPAVE